MNQHPPHAQAWSSAETRSPTEAAGPPLPGGEDILVFRPGGHLAAPIRPCKALRENLLHPVSARFARLRLDLDHPGPSSRNPIDDVERRAAPQHHRRSPGRRISGCVSDRDSCVSAEPPATQDTVGAVQDDLGGDHDLALGRSPPGCCSPEQPPRWDLTWSRYRRLCFGSWESTSDATRLETH